VVQFSALAAETGRPALIEALSTLLQPRGILERADRWARQREGLPVHEGVLQGEAPPENVEIREHGYRFLVNLWTGQKTGFYLDQRENRRFVALHCTGGEGLNAFSYTGGFAVYLLAAGMQRVINVDTSREALNLARANLRLNGFDPDVQAEHIQGNIFHLLRDWHSEGRRFDLIVLDPPKFASNVQQLAAATRGYKDINLLAFSLLRPGGLLATFSCSGLVSSDLFQKIVFGAATDARREAQIIRRLSQPPDHPILLSFPEGEYLKGLLCRVW
jgi:23S rRNA (cytosine1962-C5)-methyltransferase